MKVVVAGGTGALGRRLCDHLAERGHDVVVLTRHPRDDGWHREVHWDGLTVGEWADELVGAAVVNLAGEPVDGRPTPAGVALLTSSRVEPTRALAAAAQDADVPVWIQASTLAIHGDAGETELDEDSPIAEGPPQLAGVARSWERAARDLPAGRTVILRTSIVLDRDTPALDRLVSLTRRGLGGRVGSGRQWVSWLHVDDWLGVVSWALTGDVTGVLVVSSPNPVRNAELMASLRRVRHRRVAAPTPAAAVRLGALVLRTDPALALTGRRAVPRRLLEAGFEFRYPVLDDALADLLS